MKICKVNKCENKYAAKEYCHLHYNRMKRHGDPLVCLKQKNRKCSIEGCERTHEGHGFCNTHNWRTKHHGDPLKKFSRSMETVEKLLSFVDASGPGACWEWTKSTSKSGYGNISINGKTRLVHRVSFEIFNGEIPDRMIVCHRCDRRNCINPNHLFLGTHKDNTQDMIKKGRQHVPLGKEHWHFNGNKKLCPDDVVKIKRKIKEGFSSVKIASDFNVTTSSISGIKNNKTWKHIILNEAI